MATHFPAIALTLDPMAILKLPVDKVCEKDPRMMERPPWALLLVPTVLAPGTAYESSHTTHGVCAIKKDDANSNTILVINIRFMFV